MMMTVLRKTSLLLSLACFSLLLHAQTTDELVIYYPHDDCTSMDQSGSGSEGFEVGSFACVCGVGGQAYEFNGLDNEIAVLGNTDRYFETDDLTVALFFNPIGTNGTQVLAAKGDACSDESYFSLRYTAASLMITAELSENSSKRVVLSGTADPNKCWQHAAVVREGSNVRLYINGQLVQSASTVSRIDLTSNSSLEISGGPCIGVTDFRYRGLMDEFRVYDRALEADEVTELFTVFQPTNIITPDTTIFLGNQIDLEVNATCAETLVWDPDTDLVPGTVTLFEPSETQTYQLTFIDEDLGCASTDSIRITVIDPDNLDCLEVFMPNAFTPNNDGRNDTYGISNPYAIQELITFEIFDRWGGRVFATDNPFEQWDGTMQGEAVNPGIMLYKVRYLCNGEELSAVGSVVIMR